MRRVSRGAGLIKTTSRTYVGRNMAHVDGTNPSTGEYKYYTLDHLGSTRDVWNQSKTAYAALEYDPYGIAYATSGAAAYIDRRYTGHLWDATSQLYAAPYRAYSPTQSRWTTRDPLGMVDGPNMYGYVGGNPVNAYDRDGGFALKAICCGACIAFLGWDLYEALKTCSDESDTMGEYGTCIAKELMKQLGGGDTGACINTAIVTALDMSDMLSGIIDCFKCDIVGSFRDTGTMVSCLCCLGVLVKSTVGNPIPQPAYAL